MNDQAGKLLHLVTSLLTTLILAIFSSQTLAQDWDRNFIGQRNFELHDDPGLQSRNQDVRQAQNQYDQAEAKVKQKEREIDQLQNQKQNLAKAVSDLEGDIASNVQKKTQFQNQKDQLQRQLPALEQKVTQAQQAVQSARQEKNQAERQLENSKQKLNDVEVECKTNPQPNCEKRIANLKEQVATKERELKQKESALETAQSALKDANQDKKQTENKIAQIDSKIQDIETENQQKSQQLTQKKQQLQTKQQDLATARKELKPLQNQLNREANQLAKAQADRQDYRQNLINRILTVNSNGADNGSGDGQVDGIQLAVDSGYTYGSQDGFNQGQYDGTSTGQQREYNSGFTQGEIDGQNQAQSDGQNNGTNQGRYDGNVAAATEKAKNDGVAAANVSDASQRGTQDGQTDGMQRAVDTGKANGTKQGESEAINNNENRTLKAVQVDGSFAGTFSHQVPGFPNGYQGPSFDPRPRHPMGRDVVRMAYSAGYRAGYHQMVRRAYNRNIEGEYTRNYDRAYQEAYQQYLNQYYQDSYNQGHNDGYQRAYDAYYSGYYQQYYQMAYDQFSTNPDTSSSEYQSTYSTVYQQAYSARYQAIYDSSYQSAETQTFNNNIAEQTEIYRQKRYNEVDGVYTNNAVLEYVASQMIDTGIKGVAAQDGIYQPTEKIAHSVTIRNFGKVDATGVSVIVNGKSYTVPSIPALSQATIKGAAQSEVESSRVGSFEEKTLTVKAPVTQDYIQYRHFYAPTRGLLNSGDSKSYTVKYPMSLSALSLASELVTGEVNDLSVKLSNESYRSYEGDLDISLSTTAYGNVVIRDFPAVKTLSSSATIKGAQVLVDQERDYFRPFTIKATVSKNGVLLGSLAYPLSTMAKKAFDTQSNAAIVVANSERDTAVLLDIVDEFGGFDKVNLLDTTLGKNSSVMRKGFQKSVLYVHDNGAGSVLGSLDSTLQKSSDTVVIMTTQSGFEKLQSTTAFKHAAKAQGFQYSLTSAGVSVLFGNSYLDKNAGRLTALKSGDDSYRSLEYVAGYLTKTDEELLQGVSIIPVAFYYNPMLITVWQSLSLQIFNTRLVGEVMEVNKAYVVTDDSKYKKMIDEKNRAPFLFKKFIKKLGKVNASNVTLSLAAWDAYWVVRNAVREYDQIEDQITNGMATELLGLFNNAGSYKEIYQQDRELKKFDRNLYDTMREKKGVHSPFKLQGEEDQRIFATKFQ